MSNSTRSSKVTFKDLLAQKQWDNYTQFISEAPTFELCNTKIIHQTTGKRNMDALRVSAGSVNEAVWGEVPLLGQGQGLINSPQFSHPVLCNMRPCSTHREYTD